MRRFLLISLLWTGLHLYVVARLLSIPVLANIPAWLLIPTMILLGASYIFALLLERYGPRRLSGASYALEVIGSYWVGVFFLLLSTFLLVDLCTGFGLWLRPDYPCCAQQPLVSR